MQSQDDTKDTSAAALSHVIIYTDGAAEPNPGPGGYGVVLMAGKHRKELSAGFQLTTNNRMELMAVIVGLEALTKPCRVTVYSDSKYVVESVERGSVAKWAKNNWFRTKKDKAKNADLWKRFLDVFAKHQVRFKWVKGHAGIPENERCDVLAVEAAQSMDRTPDLGYIAETGLGGDGRDDDGDRLFAGVAQALAGDDPSGGTAGTPHSATAPKPIRPKHEIDSSIVHREAGEECRKCGTPLVKKTTKQREFKPGQTYYYEWYLLCPGCRTMYMVDSAKRSVRRS